MRAFGYEERDRFFGRDQQSYALYRLLAFGFIAVIGNSGSGKSSLVRAGLLPILLGPRESTRWRIATMTPGAEPLERLGEAIAELGPDDEDEDARSIRRERIAYRIRLSSTGIADALDEMPHLAGDSILLIVDQFEEIFRNAVSSSSDENEAFVQQLLQLHRRRPNARVLITMRSDFIGDCARFPGLPEAVSDTQYLVPTLTREQRRAAICNPIAAANATIESDLVERLLNEEDFGSDLLPILQHALSRMWIVAQERAPRAVRVTDADYRAIGTLEGTISQHADAVLAELTGREEVAESVFRALSERDSEGRATRRVLSLRQLIAETGSPDDDVRAVVDRFRAPDCAFLLPARGALTSDTRIDVVHEALLRRWERMSSRDATHPGWLDREEIDGQYYRSLLARIDSGETALQLGSVTERYAWWTSAAHTQAWADRYGGRRERVEAFFVDSLRALADFEAAEAAAERTKIEQRRQRERATRSFVVVSGSIAAVAIILLVITFFALLGSQRTTNASLVVQSDFLSRDSRMQEARGDAVDATLLALEALPKTLSDPDRPFSWQAYGALTDSLANVRELRDYTVSGSALILNYSPDGQRFATSQDNSDVWIWRLGGTKPEHILRTTGFADDVEFSADGKLIATGLNDGSVQVWSTSTGRVLRQWRLFKDYVRRAVFSRDGRTLLVSSQNDFTGLLDVSSGRLMRSVPEGFFSFWNAGSTFGDRIVTSNADNIVTIYDGSLERKLFTFGRHGAKIVSYALSADGKRIALAAADQTATVFDTSSGKVVGRLANRDGTIEHVRLSADGTLAFLSRDSYVRVWEPGTQTVLATINTRVGPTRFPEISKDGQKLAIANEDGSVAVYASRSGVQLVTVAGEQASYQVDGVFNRDASRLITSSESDGVVHEWDIHSGVSQVLDETTRSNAFNDSLNQPAVTSDGAYVAIADQFRVHVYRARDGADIRDLPYPNADSSSPTEIHFSPDGGQLLVVGDERPFLEIWNWKRNDVVRKIFPEDSSEERLWVAQFSPDGARLASISRNVLRMRDARSGRVLYRIKPKLQESGGLQFSKDGRSFLTFGEAGWVAVYATDSGKLRVTFPASANSSIFDSAFSPDGSHIATASEDKSVRIWDSSTGTLVASKTFSGVATSVDFSRDGNDLLVGSRDGAQIWNFETDRISYTFRGYKELIFKAKYADRDRRVVTIGQDNTLRLWTVPTLPVCQAAIDEARTRVTHQLSPAFAAAEFIRPRKTPSFLNVFLSKETCG